MSVLECALRLLASCMCVELNNRPALEGPNMCAGVCVEGTGYLYVCEAEQ